MLLDMVMLSGGIDKSFSEMLLARGYQIRLTPKGTLPFDTDASIPNATGLSEPSAPRPVFSRGCGSGRRCTDARVTRSSPPLRLRRSA